MDWNRLIQVIDGVSRSMQWSPASGTGRHAWEIALDARFPDWRKAVLDLGTDELNDGLPSDLDQLRGAVQSAWNRHGLVEALAGSCVLSGAACLSLAVSDDSTLAPLLRTGTGHDWIRIPRAYRIPVVLLTLEKHPGPSCCGSVADPAVLALRRVIVDAGDFESLLFLDAFLDERRGCAANGGVPGLVRKTGTPVAARRADEWTPRSPQEEAAVSRFLREILPHVDFLPELPAILYTEEDPPLFRAYPWLARRSRERRRGDDGPGDNERSETDSANVRDGEDVPEILPIESLLGTYGADKGVTIYTAGVRIAAEMLGVREEDLQAIVLVHELGHWLVHGVPVGGVGCWGPQGYEATRTEVHECFAQLAARWTCSDLGGEFLRAFDRLNQRQGPVYQAWKEFGNGCRGGVIGALAGLRSAGRGASLGHLRAALKNGTAAGSVGPTAATPQGQRSP